MYTNLDQELLVEDTRTNREIMRMSYKWFKKTLDSIELNITPKDSIVTGAQLIRQAKRSVLAIKFYATGEAYRFSSLQFRVSERRMSYIIDNATKAIGHHIGKDCIKIPSTSEDLL